MAFDRTCADSPPDLSNSESTPFNSLQQNALSLALSGTDLFVHETSGREIQRAYNKACIQAIDPQNSFPQALVLVATRESALETADALKKLADKSSHPSIEIGAYIGGQAIEEQKKALHRVCHIIVGTPGRVCALLEKGDLVTPALKILVLHEANNLMSDTFEGDILWIHSVLPKEKQVLTFSALNTPELQKRVELLMRHPKRILPTKEATFLSVRHFYKLVAGCRKSKHRWLVPADDENNSSELTEAKWSSLLEILESARKRRVLIFSADETDASRVCHRLGKAGQPYKYLSGGDAETSEMPASPTISQTQPELIASVTDDTANSLHLGDPVKNSNHSAATHDADKQERQRISRKRLRWGFAGGFDVVVNVELPREAATYWSRIGATAGSGFRRLAISVIRPDQLQLLEELVEGCGGAELQRLPEALAELIRQSEADYVIEPPSEGLEPMAVDLPMESEPEPVRGYPSRIESGNSPAKLRSDPSRSEDDSTHIGLSNGSRNAQPATPRASILEATEGAGAAEQAVGRTENATDGGGGEGLSPASAPKAGSENAQTPISWSDLQDMLGKFPPDPVAVRKKAEPEPQICLLASDPGVREMSDAEIEAAILQRLSEDPCEDPWESGEQHLPEDWEQEDGITEDLALAAYAALSAEQQTALWEDYYRQQQQQLPPEGGGKELEEWNCWYQQYQELSAVGATLPVPPISGETKQIPLELADRGGLVAAPKPTPRSKPQEDGSERPGALPSQDQGGGPGGNPPSFWFPGVSCVDDDGFLRVPAGLLARYYELEQHFWQQTLQRD